MAVTIEALSDQVWPWLVQMGGDRGDWYSWDRLDNGGRPSAQEVHPEWQDLTFGDYMKYWTRVVRSTLGRSQPLNPIASWDCVG
jgi:hypothetical protein